MCAYTMDPTVPDAKEDYNVRNSSDIPSHGSIPKWLEDISKKIVRDHSALTEKSKRFTYNGLDMRNYFGDDERFSRMESQDSDNPNSRQSESTSAKFGRRSSLASQLLANSPSKNITITKSEYLVPRFDGKFDFKSLHSDPHQIDLEKSWKSLDNFKQSHKGRLDSAKNFAEYDGHFGDYDYVLSPISSNENSESEIGPTYSPSLLDHDVPNRSHSEMSNYVPSYQYNAVKKLAPHRENLPMGDKKSKSTENIFKANEMPKFADTSVSQYDFYSRQPKYDPIFEKKLNDYHMKIDKENKLREEIISELLSENERITEKLRQHNLDDEFLEPSLHRKLYNSNSKYKSKHHKKAQENIFIIPELPTGKTLIVDILSTWGDRHYVGLNGIEIFGVDGKIVKVKKITAVPPDVNVLPECNSDPRVVSNLLDGVNRTQDDMHIWLAPFEMGCSHLITIDFKEVTTLSMIRIWNYNKSRIHSYRGVRDIVMFLDDQAIFKGEIAKACGGMLGGVDAFGDTILFTTNDAILENISRNDSSFSYLTSEPTTPHTVDRPPTATLASDVRPITGPANNSQKASPTDQILLGSNQMDIILLSNWGHANMIGLTGLELLEGTDSVINLSQSYMSCNSRTGNSYLPTLINGENITTDEENMWRVPYKFEEEVVITIAFENFRYISGIRVWNYNGSLETSYGGVRALKILLDGKPVKNPITKNEIFILRRAPGNQHYDFVQDLKFIEDISDFTEESDESHSLLDRNEFYEPSTMPEGFVFQIIIFSSWGDQYYCGLNGIELYNQYGKKIPLDEQNICAYPESVNSLPDVLGDIRTPDKLIDGINDDHTGSHSWLAPIIPKHLNRIYIVMDQPIVVSFVKLWNYSKTPSRAVKEFGILVDDLLVYNGTLEKYSNHVDGYQTVLFTENEAIIGEEYETLIRNSAYQQDVILLDQDLRTTTGGSLPEADPALRPFTSVSPFNRGYTSHSH